MNKLETTKKMHESVGIEFVHGDLYGVAMDVAKKFVAKSDTRPILKYAHHDINGNVIATDSHQLIKIYNIHGFSEEYIIDPKNLMVAKTDRFPKADDLIEHARENSEETVILERDHIHLWYNIFKSIVSTMKAMKVRSHNKTVDLHFEGSGVTVHVESLNLNFTLPFALYEKPEKTLKIRFNSDYMKNALEAHCKLNAPRLTMLVNGHMRPIVLKTSDLVTTLVLPVRIYE